jgi:hypothetical protein
MLQLAERKRCRGTPSLTGGQQRRWRLHAGRAGRLAAAAKKQSAAAGAAVDWSEEVEEELGPAAQATLRMLDWGRLCSQVGGLAAPPCHQHPPLLIHHAPHNPVAP